MSIQSGTFTYILGKKEYQFGLLSVQDLVNISNSINHNSVVNLDDLEKHSRNPLGCEIFLLLAGKKVNPELTKEDVSKMGSILRRTQDCS